MHPAEAEVNLVNLAPKMNFWNFEGYFSAASIKAPFRIFAFRSRLTGGSCLHGRPISVDFGKQR